MASFQPSSGHQIHLCLHLIQDLPKLAKKITIASPNTYVYQIYFFRGWVGKWKKNRGFKKRSLWWKKVVNVGICGMLY